MTLWQNMIRGIALGDSWGDPTEFATIENIVRDNPMGPAVYDRLRITDDTQMTLYLADALDETWGKDEDTVKAAIIQNFLTYNVDPDNNRAPGITVTGSLHALARYADNNPVQNWVHSTNHQSDGCGTVMRTAPTAFLPMDLWVGVTAFAAAVTHCTANGVASAILNVAILRDAMNGRVKAGQLTERALELAERAAKGHTKLTEVGTWLNGLDIKLTEGFAYLAQELRLSLAELPKLQANPWALESDPSMQPGTIKPNGRGGGWRAHSCLISALLAVDMLPAAPYQALRRAVITDGDSDSIGAVAGGLIGALSPTAFLNLWTTGFKGGDTLKDRLEGRYVNWIENEADNYRFEDPKVSV